MKKHLFASVFLIQLLALPLQGQNPDDAVSASTHEIGLNASALVDQLLNFSSESNLSPGPYVLAYKHIKALSGKKRKAFRMAFGIRLEESTDDNAFPTSVQDFKVRSTQLALRLGGESQWMLGKRWTFSSGFDYFLVELSGTKIFSGDDLDDLLTSSFNTKVGLGPVLGIQFFFDKNVSLATESSLYATYNFKKNKTNFSSGFDDEQEIQSFELVLQMPVNLFLSIRF